MELHGCKYRKAHAISPRGEEKRKICAEIRVRKIITHEKWRINNAPTTSSLSFGEGLG
jgi:hypothetical protein